jgi:hypothetical protein
MWSNELPVETAKYWNGEALEALKQIRGQHAAKKRATVLLLAYATATDTPLARVFEDERACNQRVWYQKWQHIPEVARALSVCTDTALAYRDLETMRVEAQAAQALRRGLALGRLDAVTGLRQTALEKRDGSGIDAARTLLQARSTGDTNAPVALDEGGPVAMPVEVVNGAEFGDGITAGFVAEVLRELGAVGGLGDGGAAGDPGQPVDSA